MQQSRTSSRRGTSRLSPLASKDRFTFALLLSLVEKKRRRRRREGKRARIDARAEQGIHRRVGSIEVEAEAASKGDFVLFTNLDKSQKNKLGPLVSCTLRPLCPDNSSNSSSSSSDFKREEEEEEEEEEEDDDDDGERRR